MQYYFDRVCQIVIENRSQTVIEGLQIKFEIIKSMQAKENTAKIEIFNLSLELRNQLNEEESLVRIYAGYSMYKGLVEIGQGDITKIRTNRNETDIATEMYLAEGLKKTRNNPIALSYTKDVKLGDILTNITASTGFTFRQIDMDSSKVIANSYADMGSLDHILSNLSLEYNFNWSIQNGVILLKGKKVTNNQEIMLFTPESGLIVNPESVRKISRRLQKSKIVDQEEDKMNVQVMLQPQLQVSDIIAVESENLKGKFRIEKITHIGDTHENDWYSDLEVVAI